MKKFFIFLFVFFCFANNDEDRFNECMQRMQSQKCLQMVDESFVDVIAYVVNSLITYAHEKGLNFTLTVIREFHCIVGHHAIGNILPNQSKSDFDNAVTKAEELQKQTLQFLNESLVVSREHLAQLRDIPLQILLNFQSYVHRNDLDLSKKIKANFTLLYKFMEYLFSKKDDDLSDHANILSRFKGLSVFLMVENFQDDDLLDEIFDYFVKNKDAFLKTDWLDEKQEVIETNIQKIEWKLRCLNSSWKDVYSSDLYDEFLSMCLHDILNFIDQSIFMLLCYKVQLKRVSLMEFRGLYSEIIANVIEPSDSDVDSDSDVSHDDAIEKKSANNAESDSVESDNIVVGSCMSFDTNDNSEESYDLLTDKKEILIKEFLRYCFQNCSEKIKKTKKIKNKEKQKSEQENKLNQLYHAYQWGQCRSMIQEILQNIDGFNDVNDLKKCKKCIDYLYQVIDGSLMKKFKKYSNWEKILQMIKNDRILEEDHLVVQGFFAEVKGELFQLNVAVCSSENDNILFDSYREKYESVINNMIRGVCVQVDNVWVF